MIGSYLIIWCSIRKFVCTSMHPGGSYKNMDRNLGGWAEILPHHVRVIYPSNELKIYLLVRYLTAAI